MHDKKNQNADFLHSGAFYVHVSDEIKLAFYRKESNKDQTAVRTGQM
jgi:hypothetical protein